MSQTYEDNDYRELLAAVFSAPLPPHVLETGYGYGSVALARPGRRS